MRSVQVGEITKNIKEMCIEANYFLSPDMKKVFDESVKKRNRPLESRSFISWRKIWKLPERIRAPSVRTREWPLFLLKSDKKSILKAEA